MKTIKNLLNKKVDCTHLVKVNEDGSYDLTNVYIRGMIEGGLTAIAGFIIGCVIDQYINS